MNYKDFISLCLCNARNSIEVSNAKSIMPIKSNKVEISYLDDKRLVINSSIGKTIIWAENGYFRCDEILKSIANVYNVEYVDNSFRNLLCLRKNLLNAIEINEGEI